MLPFNFTSYVTLSRIFDNVPKGTNLLHYLSQPVHTVKDPLSVANKAYTALLNRTPLNKIHIGFNTLDTNIFISRFKIIGDNNRFYYIACKNNPNVYDLEEISFIKANWSILYALKQLLHHNPDMALKYRGLVPLGAPVIKFFNTATSSEIPDQNPSLAAHIGVQKMTNSLAKKLNVSSMTVNDLMYLEGEQLINKEKEMKR